MAAKTANLNKNLMAANREKESMVMKFAVREKDILVSQRKAEEADKKMKVFYSGHNLGRYKWQTFENLLLIFRPQSKREKML